MHALRRDRPVRRLLPQIIQLEIAIVRPGCTIRARDLLRILTLLNRRGRAARRRSSRCVRGRRASSARRDMSFLTASESTVRTNERTYERTNGHEARSTTSAGVRACVNLNARSKCVRACVRTRERLSTNVGAPDFGASRTHHVEIGEIRRPTSLRCCRAEKPTTAADEDTTPERGTRRRRRRRRKRGRNLAAPRALSPLRFRAPPHARLTKAPPRNTRPF